MRMFTNSLSYKIKRLEAKDLFEKNSININFEGFPSGVYYVRKDIGCLTDIQCLTKSFVVIDRANKTSEVFQTSDV